MVSLRTGYRILISNYGYYGSIKEPYVMYEILEKDGSVDLVEKYIDLALEKYPYPNSCLGEELNVIEKLEHLVVAVQTEISGIPLKCLHSHSYHGQIIRIPEKTSLLVPLVNRVFTEEIIEHILDELESESIPIFIESQRVDLLQRLPDSFISLILQILHQYDIPAHDIEDDSRLIALGEGKHCIVIRKKLISKELIWLKPPFQVLDLDEMDPNSFQTLNLESLMELSDLKELENKLAELWPEFKNLVHHGIVPKHLVSGTNGKTTTSRMIAHIIREVKRGKMGLTSTSGIFIDGEEPDYGDFTGPWSARQLLLNDIDEVVLETARGGLIREGVIFEKVETATLTNVAADHIGLRDISSVEQMGQLKSLIYKAATKCIVTNVDDPVIMDIVYQIQTGKFSLQEGCEIWGTSSLNNTNPYVKNMVYLENEDVILKRHGVSKKIGNIRDFLFSDGGTISFMNINALSALAATIGYGMNPEDVYHSICTFKADVEYAPGRGNFLRFSDRYIMLDYGHNPHALFEIKKTIENILRKYSVNKVIFLSLSASDRRDEDLKEYGRIVATFPIDIIIFKDMWVDRRGKDEGEMGRFIAEEVINSGFKGVIYHKPNPIDAIKFSLELSSPEDLLYLCAEKAEIMMKIIEEFDFSKN